MMYGVTSFCNLCLYNYHYGGIHVSIIKREKYEIKGKGMYEIKELALCTTPPYLNYYYL